jgi:hypothetical protein
MVEAERNLCGVSRPKSRNSRSCLIYKSNLGENKSIMIDDEEFYLIRESEVGLVKSAK